MNITVEEYLREEDKSQIRHEFVDGRIYAMTGSTDAHNQICGNLFAFLHQRLQGTGCRIYMNDMKVRIDATNCFYYPDLMVTCEPYDARSVYKKQPSLVIEVLSRSTRNIDSREKLIAYKTLDSLTEYLVVSQFKQAVILYRREGNVWQSTEWLTGTEIELRAIPGDTVMLPVSTVYKDTEIPE